MKAALGYAAVAFGAGASVVGITALLAGLQMRDKFLLRFGRRCVFAVFVAALAAAGVMEWALLSHDFSIRYVAENNALGTPLLFTITGLWAALEGSILLWAVILGGYLTFVAFKFRARGQRPARRGGDDHRPRRRAVLLRADAGAGQPVRDVVDGAVRRPGSEPAAAEPHPDGVPPADPLHGLRRVHRPVHVRHRRARHRALRRGLAHRHPPGDARGLGLPHRGHHPRRVVELRGARLGWLLGVGPGRERVAAAVAHRHRVHPLGDHPGTARDAARLEPVARHRDVLPHDPRHLPHPFGRHRLGARVHAVRHRAVAARVPRRDRGDGHRSDRVARRPAPFARAHRLRGLARVGVPRQQPAVRRARVRRAARHRVPAHRRGAARLAAVGGGAVLRPDGHADRSRAAVPDGGSARVAVAGDERRSGAQPADRARVDRRPHHAGRGDPRRARTGRDPGLRPRRVRGRRDRAPVRARHPRSSSRPR